MNRLVVILAGIVVLIFAGDAFAQKKINQKFSAGASFKAQLTGPPTMMAPHP